MDYKRFRYRSFNIRTKFVWT